MKIKITDLLSIITLMFYLGCTKTKPYPTGEPTEFTQEKFKHFTITASRFEFDSLFDIYYDKKLVFEQAGHVFYIGGDSILGTPHIAPGTDITGDGKPNLVFYEWSGGAHCCFIATVLELSKPVREVAVIDGRHTPPTFEDLNGDGICEVILCDWTYEYWPQSFAGSPAPKVVLKYENDKYVVAPEFMRQPAPSQADMDNSLKSIQYNDRSSYLSQIFRYALNLMYTGHEQLGWDYIDRAWPKDDAENKKQYVTQLKQLMSQSPYWKIFKKQ